MERSPERSRGDRAVGEMTEVYFPGSKWMLDITGVHHRLLIELMRSVFVVRIQQLGQAVGETQRTIVDLEFPPMFDVETWIRCFVDDSTGRLQSFSAHRVDKVLERPKR